MSDRLLFSVSESLKALGICRAKFYEEARAGRIKLRKIGNKSVVSAADLSDYVNNLPTAPIVLK